MSPREQLLYASTRVNLLREHKVVSSGTGFFFNYSLEGRTMPVLYTNKHVIEGGDAIRFVVHLSNDAKDGPSGVIDDWYQRLGPNNVLMHPDPEVDLCCIGLSNLLDAYTRVGRNLFFRTFSDNLLPTEDEWRDFDGIEEVMMIGCPNGLFDETNGLPLSRRGITASHLGKRYNGREEFLVDLACYPGSSGSPIVLVDQNTFDREQGTYVFGRGRLKLVGILSAGPQINKVGRIILGQEPRAVVPSMMHLGQAIRSSRINDFREPLMQALQEKLDSEKSTKKA